MISKDRLQEHSQSDEVGFCAKSFVASEVPAQVNAVQVGLNGGSGQ